MVTARGSDISSLTNEIFIEAFSGIKNHITKSHKCAVDHFGLLSIVIASDSERVRQGDALLATEGILRLRR